MINHEGRWQIQCAELGMHLNVVSICTALALCCLLPLDVYASPPLPQEKPLPGLGNSQFIEGVDVPAIKPATLQEEPLAGPDDGGRKASAGESSTPATCDIPGATFEQLAPMQGDQADEDCGITVPVNLSGLRGKDAEVTFPMKATLSCGFATSLTAWVIEDVLPIAQAQFGKPVSEFLTGPGYQCRRRNNLPDGKLSEHALGKAIDIVAFRLSDGIEISVEKDWARNTQSGSFLFAIHKAACKRFTTVLGPDADPNHKSHFHLDIGCHGKSCNYIICQ